MNGIQPVFGSYPCAGCIEPRNSGVRVSPANLELLHNLLIIAGLALAAHVAVRLVRAGARVFLSSRLGSISQAATVTRFLGSAAAFAIWFVAIGFGLRELGVSLETYVASATVIGLAVSFGSQSLVQDVISGLTLIFTGLVEVGDMVDLNGQVGVVETIGMRYTEIRNVQGAVIYISNRNITTVTKFPVGYVRVFIDAILPPDHAEEGKRALEAAAAEAHRQFSGIMIKEPSVQLLAEGDAAGRPMGRVKFRIWPGQGGIIETAAKLQVIGTLKAIDPNYADWMVAVHYRVEPAFVRRATSAKDVLRGLVQDAAREGDRIISRKKRN
jgi:moderate conductance mechanosensitive channel